MRFMRYEATKSSPRVKATVVFGLHRMVPFGACGYSQATNDVDDA